MSWKKREQGLNALGHLSKRQKAKMNLLNSVLLPSNALDEGVEDWRLSYPSFKAKHLKEYLLRPNRYEGRDISEILNKVPLSDLKRDLANADSECKAAYITVIEEALLNTREGIPLEMLRQYVSMPGFILKAKSYCRQYGIPLWKL